MPVIWIAQPLERGNSIPCLPCVPLSYHAVYVPFWSLFVGCVSRIIVSPQIRIFLAGFSFFTVKRSPGR